MARDRNAVKKGECGGSLPSTTVKWNEIRRRGREMRWKSRIGMR
jgi:hypothetical protein